MWVCVTWTKYWLTFNPVLDNFSRPTFITMVMHSSTLCVSEIQAVYSAEHKHSQINTIMSAAGFWLRPRPEHLSRPPAQITTNPADQCVLPFNNATVNMINVTLYAPFSSSLHVSSSSRFSPPPPAGETFSENYSHTEKCKPCKECTGLMRLKTPCTDSNDAVCVCNYNYFFNYNTGRCEHCTVCPVGEGVFSHCDHEHDTVCEECVDNTFSDRESSLEPCLPCTICDEDTETELAECTPTRDSVCHSKSTAKQYIIHCCTTLVPVTNCIAGIHSQNIIWIIHARLGVQQELVEDKSEVDSRT